MFDVLPGYFRTLLGRAREVSSPDPEYVLCYGCKWPSPGPPDEVALYKRERGVIEGGSAVSGSVEGVAALNLLFAAAGLSPIHDPEHPRPG